MRRILIAAIAVFVLVVAYSAYWHVMASRSGEWVAYWAAPQPGKSWHGSFGESEVSGFPFSLDIRITDPTVTWQGSAGAAVWRGPWLVASFKPWTFASLDFDLPPEQTVLIDDGVLVRSIGVSMASGTATVTMDDGQADGLAGLFRRVVVHYEDGRPPVTADQLDISVTALDDSSAFEAGVVIHNLGLAGQVVPPFDAVVPRVETSLRWNGALMGSGSLAQRLEAWRVAGGTVDVTAFAVDWPPLDVTAAGTLALDGELRPIGAFRTEIIGYRDLLDAMGKGGGLDRGQATVAGAALDFMAVRQADGRMQLAVDVSIQHGLLSVGPIPVMPVAPVLPAEAGF
ncbi:MAG: DUF2125 domain-containing protein [Rhodospirillales bacterium]|nr:DUF2125 domain-containing protein [Rhodospirillales bacterium]